MPIKIGVDYFQDGMDMYKNKQARPKWDSIALTSFLIDGWEQAAKEAKEPGYECNCISFDCPYH